MIIYHIFFNETVFLYLALIFNVILCLTQRNDRHAERTRFIFTTVAK